MGLLGLPQAGPDSINVTHYDTYLTYDGTYYFYLLLKLIYIKKSDSTNITYNGTYITFNGTN